MKPAIVLDANDIKTLIAEKYGIKPEEVIKSQYSYTVVLNEGNAREDDFNNKEIWENHRAEALM